jgi:hypothetical protein
MSSIRADIELNAAPFIGGIAKVQRQIRNLQAAAAGITAAFLAARAAIAGLSGVLSEMKGALDLGGQLSDLSASTGASVSELVVLRQALANAGMGADAAGPMIARFQRALAGVNEDGVTTRGVLEELGINTLALSRMSLQDQFTELSRVIAAIEDPADRAAAAIKLFGRSGVEMLAFMRDPAAFTMASEQVGELGNVLEANANRFDSVSDAIEAMGLKIDQFFVGFMSEISGLDVFENLAKADFTTLGQSAGQASSALIQLVASLRSLLPVFVGVGAATMAFKLGIGQSVVTAASQFPAAMASMAASMASPRTALVALGTAARTTFTGMVAAARAASIGIKAALASTGIGLAVVAAGELLAYAMGQRDKVNQTARNEKSIVGKTSRMAKRYGTTAQAIASPEDQSAVIDRVSEEIESARERIDTLDESFPDLGAEALAQFETRLRERILMLEAIKDMAANIPPEIMEANAAEKHRGEALAESKRQAEELARELERALATRDQRAEQAALDSMTPEQAARAVLDKATLRTEGNEITFDAAGLTAEVERLKSLGTKATDAEKQRLYELLSIEEQLLAVQKRQTEEDTKSAEQQEKLSELRRDMLLDAEQISAEASGDTERVRAIETERRATAITKQLEEQGQDPITAAELGRRQAELEQLRRESTGSERGPVQVADASRQVGLGGRFFGEDRKPQEEMVRKQAESNRLLAEIRSLLASQPRQLLAETFD